MNSFSLEKKRGQWRAKAYQQLQKAKSASIGAIRRARAKSDTPWMNQAEYAEMEAMYLYNYVMPGCHHVDHIEPLAKGGMHHPTNLQLLTKSENLSKHDRYTRDDEQAIKEAQLAVQRQVGILFENAKWQQGIPFPR